MVEDEAPTTLRAMKVVKPSKLYRMPLGISISTHCGVLKRFTSNR